MNTSNPDDERVTVCEAVGATALVAFAAFAFTTAFAFLAARCVVVDAIDHCKKKFNQQQKGGTHV